MLRLLPLVLAACTLTLDGPDAPDVVPVATGVECDDTELEMPAPGDTCVVMDLACGDVVEHRTDGGSHVFDRSVWEGATCLDWLASDGGELDGPERVYGLDVPAGQTATVSLASPCADLDLRVVHTVSPCNTAPSQCTAGTGDFRGSQVSSLVGASSGERYEIIVDGYEGDAGNFRLSVDCTGT